MFNDEEAVEVADYARTYGVTAATTHYGCSGSVIKRCLRKFPEI